MANRCGGAVANRLRRRTSDQTVLGSNPAVAAALRPWTRLFTPMLSQGEAFTLASISYLAILVKYILVKIRQMLSINKTSHSPSPLLPLFLSLSTFCLNAVFPKKTQQTDLTFSHKPIFAPFSSVAIQREQRKNQEQGNIYKDLSVRSCAESVCVCAVYVCEMFVWLLVYVSTNFYDGCVRCVHWNNVRPVCDQSNIVSAHTTHAPIIEVGRYIH